MPSQPARAEWFALLLPLLLAVAGYARALRGELLFDDLPGIVENQAIKDLGTWLRGASFPEALLTGRPLTTLSFAVNYALGRLDPLGYHLVNLALHLATVLLVGALASRVAVLAGAERPRRIALGVAGLFAVHPLQSQAVAYVSQRAEILASALTVAALLVLLRRDPGTSPRPWGTSVVALSLLVLAFGAKPMAVTLPAAWLLLLNAAPGAAGQTPAWRRALLPAAGLGAVAALLSAALLVALRGKPDAGFSVAGITPWTYLLTEFQVLVVYLRLLLWPAGQSADWAFPASPGLGDPATLASAALILALLAVTARLLWRWRRAPGPDGAAARLAGLGVLWFFLVLAPTSTIVPLADALAEHRTYLASWGIFLAAVAAGDWLAARRGVFRTAAAAWGLALLALTAALHQRAAVWESREALWRDALAKQPSARAHGALAEALDALGRTDEAIREYEAALRATGDGVRPAARVLVNLAVAQGNAGRWREARANLERAIAIRPDDELALVNLAMLAGAEGDTAGAEALARRAIAANPSQALAWVVFGNLARTRHDPVAALTSYERAVALDPERGEAHYGRALALESLGRFPEACSALREALRADLLPDLRAEIGARVAARCR